MLTQQGVYVHNLLRLIGRSPHFFQEKSVFFSFSCISFKYVLYQSLTVSSVGAPWRCGVLTTAGIGMGRLLGRGHDPTPQSGVEAPRLLKRSQTNLYYCCCCCCCCFGRDLTGRMSIAEDQIVQEPSMAKNSAPTKAPKNGAQRQCELTERRKKKPIRDPFHLRLLIRSPALQ